MGIPVKPLIGRICHDKIVFSEYMSSINAENNNRIALIDIIRGNNNGNLS